jgi:hypothetical protein
MVTLLMGLGSKINSLKESSSTAMETDIKEILMILPDMDTVLTNTQTNPDTKECGKTTKKMAKVLFH